MIKKDTVYIVTFHRSFSHGALLQCLGSQHFLSQYNEKVCVLNYYNKEIESNYKLFKRILLSNGFVFFAKRKITQLLDSPFWIIKKIRFRFFRKKYLNVSKIKIKKTIDIKKIKNALAFFVGSDQVWNTDLTGGIDDIYFLKFQTSSKRVSLAASIGKDFVGFEESRNIKKYVSCFDYITVRERKTKELLEPIDKEINVICDPVFLNNKQYWLSLIKNKCAKRKKYILVYDLTGDSRIEKYATWLSKNKELHIVEISRGGWKDRKIGMRVNSFSPLDLLVLIHGSEFILTNSFHGIAFSIIFEKQFIAFSPKMRASRVFELLERFKLNNNLFNDNISFEDLLDSSMINYEVTSLLVENYSKESRMILEKIIRTIKN